MSKKVYIDTLGCSKNTTDSEYAMSLLEKEGYMLTDAPEDADVVMVNTCGFIEDAKRESIEHIFQAAERKGKEAKLVVTGCLAQRYAEELFKEIPEADLFLGVNEYDRLPEYLSDMDERSFHAGDCNLDHLERTVRHLGDNPYSATIKIAEGCNNRCTYCIIPKIRGKFRSKRMEDIIAEARELSEAGCRELILIAQDVAYYGVDLYGRESLPELLKELCRVDGIRWIRLMYCYDDRITEELIQVMSSEEKICHYIDIPLQHGSDRILKRMNRNSSRESMRNTIARLREKMPDIVIRTTLMVGFPGETQEDYEELLSMVEEEKFDRLGVFAYSREEGTPAGNMEDQVDVETKEKRLEGIMLRQMEISLAHNRSLVGSTMEVLVTGKDPDGSYIGRTYGDAPEIDNSVLFTSDVELKEGDFVSVKILDAFDYDLVGEVEGLS